MKREQNSSVLPHSLRNFAVKISRVLKKTREYKCIQLCNLRAVVSPGRTLRETTTRRVSIMRLYCGF